MIHETVTYTDYNGMSRTETFYFHFTQAEIMEMQLSVEGGFNARVQRMIDAKDQPSIIKLVKDFVLDAYGVKSEDGRRFMKNEEIRKSFEENPAYSIIFMKLATDADAASKFVNGVAPSDMPRNTPAIAAAN